jgi:ectoine hydroxylase-related dioxygenase (phytanoyl-CoA dioxygenase family)
MNELTNSVNELSVVNALSHDGYVIILNVLTRLQYTVLTRKVAQHTSSVGSRRLLEEPWCKVLAAEMQMHPLLAHVLADLMVVQCTYFEKSQSKNWLVSVHQDLSIPVAEKIDHPALKGWAQKEGALFVQAPDQVLSQLIALRIHLDDCTEKDGALRVLPKSHLQGRITQSAANVPLLRSEYEEVSCEVGAGGVMLMKPLLLHSSSKSTGRSLRRVLHFVFGPKKLPFGLRWT